MAILVTTFKGLRKLKEILFVGFYTPLGKVMLILNGVVFKSGLRVKGLIHVDVTRRGKFSIGNNFCINSGDRFNVIGRQQKCIFWVEGSLHIKDNVGMSGVAIICHHQISIGNNVLVGGNTVIYDTDFHSLDPSLRSSRNTDELNTRWGAVIIDDNVFIGAHSTILKGVHIGKNSVVGAGSVVTKSIPPNEIWAGNPARFIRSVLS
jgi:acetyltransferase-like isoleucine patch superfamily enzyme